jgi:hypothetical protein
VDVALINENNKTLGNSSITLETEAINFSSGDRIVRPPRSVIGVVNFPNVSAADLTPTLTIVIVAVNGIRTRDLSASGYMRIETSDLEVRFLVREREERIAQEQLEREQRQRRAQTREFVRLLLPGVALVGLLVVGNLFLETSEESVKVLMTALRSIRYAQQ